MTNIVSAAFMLGLWALLLGSPAPAIAASAPAMVPAPITPDRIDWASPPLRTFYADPVGQGSGKTRRSPLAFTKLLPTLRPGDRVILLPGSYRSARISLKGTASRPIRIEAGAAAVTGDGLELPPSSKVLFQNSSLHIQDSAYLRIQGLAFQVDPAKAGSGIKVTRSSHLAFQRNSFVQHTNYGLLLDGVATTDLRQILVENNLFQNMLASGEPGGIGGVRMDYGLRVHGTDTLIVRGNRFEGYFNHALSLKERVRNARIEDNLFQTCGLVCVEGGQEPDTAFGTRMTDRTVANVIVTANRFVGKFDGTVGVFARNVERIFITANRFQGITEPLRIANNDRNPKNCARQLYLVGRTYGSCEPDSRMTQIGRRNAGVLWGQNRIEGAARFIVAGRGYAGDFLSIRNATNTGKVEICRRPFILNEADFNGWTDGLPATRAAPKLYLDASKGFVVRTGECLGKDLTHDCEADRSCSGIND